MTPNEALDELFRRWPDEEALEEMTDDENSEYARLCRIADPDAFDIGASQDAYHSGL